MSLHPYTHQLLEAALKVPDRTHRLGRAVFLYGWLITQANAKGIICREYSTIARELEIPEAEGLAWLERLVSCRLVEVLTGPPHLVLKLPLWSAHEPSAIEKSRKSSESAGDAREIVPVSSKQQAAANENIGVGGAGEGVFAEVANLLGGTDAQEIREQLDQFPEELIRRVIARVRATPERHIRVSRLALFRFLLTKLSHESHAN